MNLSVCLSLQCHVAAMMAASAASYSSVNQYDGNRSIMWRHLNSCSSCDGSNNTANNNSFRRQSSMRACRNNHQHYHHTRKPAIRQNKRCTFATTATTILSQSTLSSTKCGNTSTSLTQSHQRQHQKPSDRRQQSMDFEPNTHKLCQSQSSNSSNTSSIRIID